MTDELILKILYNMKNHEENNLIIFGDKKQNTEALKAAIVALKFTNFVLTEFNHLDGVDFGREFRFLQCREE